MGVNSGVDIPPYNLHLFALDGLLIYRVGRRVDDLLID